MEDLIGVYGILDLDHWPNAPFLLLDGGVEKRWKEPYAFHNTDRGTYSGWLMQYTLSGTGWFEKNGKTYEMRPGRGFLCQIPENSRYYLHPESEEPWIFLYFHFRGSAVSYAAERLFEKTKVKSVNTMNMDGKNKRRGMVVGKTAKSKKAIVALTEDSKDIEIFEGL